MLTISIRQVAIALAVLFAAFGQTRDARAAVRIKDITDISGARGNQIYGLGLVVGLNGTGARSLATRQLAIDMLRKNDVTTRIARQQLTDNVFETTSISMVWVTAELPPFSRKGSQLDVTVSTLDDAASLQGGTLVLTPLKGVDGEVYAVAQGGVSIGGFNVGQGGQNTQRNHPTSGRISRGAIVEREARGTIAERGEVRLLLRQPDASTAKIIAQTINMKFPESARTMDPGTIGVVIPKNYQRTPVEFASMIGTMEVLPDMPARVIIYEKTGTVVVGSNVKVDAVAIAHKNLVVQPVIPPAPPQLPGPTAAALLGIDPAPQANGAGADAGPVNPNAPAAGNRITVAEPSYTVADLARVLNALGASPQDMIAIFQTLHKSGALHAQLITM